MMDLVTQNKWWKGIGWEKEDSDLKKINIYLERNLIDVKRYHLTILRGIRRSGKTVYLKKIVGKLIKAGVDPKDILYLSCDRLSRSRIINITNEIVINRGGGYLLLDEITYKDGINPNLIYGICQDHKGFIWIGSEQGLQRYDGYEFVDYSNQINYNRVNNIIEDRRGIIWICTINGIYLI